MVKNLKEIFGKKPPLNKTAKGSLILQNEQLAIDLNNQLERCHKLEIMVRNLENQNEFYRTNNEFLRDKLNKIQSTLDQNKRKDQKIFIKDLF